MINREILGFARRFVRALFALVADSAGATLLAQHFLIPSSVYAVSLPFALFNVMLVAQVFSV
jgi:hypothetical protein